MAGIKITDLPEDNQIKGNDSLLKVSDGVTYQIKGEAFLNKFNAITSAFNIAQNEDAAVSEVLAGISNDGNIIYFNPLSGSDGVYTYNNIQTSAVVVGIAPQSIDNTKMGAYSVGTPNIIDGSITSSKMNQIDNYFVPKAWANFSPYINPGQNGRVNTFLWLTGGYNFGRWRWDTNWTDDSIGLKYYFNAITGVYVAPQTDPLYIRGVDVALSGIRITSIDPIDRKIANFEFLGGVLEPYPNLPLSAQRITINGNGTVNGYAFFTYGIREAFNIKKVTLMGTGDYYLEFQTKPTSPYYCAVANAGGKRRIFPPYAANSPTTWAATSNAGIDGFYVFTNATSCPVNHVVVYGK
jgi:hypothetical protein